MSQIRKRLDESGLDGFDLHVARLANLCARLFCEAGSHISFPEDALTSLHRPLLAAALLLRELIAKTPQGRKALADLGFQPVLQNIDGE